LLLKTSWRVTTLKLETNVFEEKLQATRG
jgi:hypothetical protein